MSVHDRLLEHIDLYISVKHKEVLSNAHKNGISSLLLYHSKKSRNVAMF